jgi:two-component sensor histidine kinase
MSAAPLAKAPLPAPPVSVPPASAPLAIAPPLSVPPVSVPPAIATPLSVPPVSVPPAIATPLSVPPAVPPHAPLQQLPGPTPDNAEADAGKWRGGEEEERTPCTFEDELGYVHAVALIPLAESSSAEPFLLDESGLEDERRVMVVDLAGLRFYLSLIRTDAPSVSKSGLLLLAKQDALRLRYDHERVLNNLRLRGSLLPAEFGTVVRGRDELLRRVEFRLSALLELVVQLSAVERWQLAASVLDAKLVRTMSGGGGGASRGSSHEGGRSRGTRGGKRVDVQTLERLLNREKKLARSILDVVAEASDRHTVEFQIGLGGGMSDDWKPILRAGFTVFPSHLPRFYQAIVEAQNFHPLEEPMLHLTGTTESFSLSM